MPWCSGCDRFYNPNSLMVDGSCPSCGERVAEPLVLTDQTEQAPGAPWHFKLLIAATAIYLGYRLFQGVLWVAQQL